MTDEPDGKELDPCQFCRYRHPDSHFEPRSKDEIKNAIKEWMDDRFAALGKWTIVTIFTTMFGWLIYALLSMNGWHR